MNSKERFLHVEKRVHMLIKFAIAWYIMLWLSTMWVSFNYLFYSSPIWLLTTCPLFLKFLLFNEIYSYGSLGLLLHLQHGYAVIDLQILGPLKIEDICMMKFLSLVLQVLLILHMNIFSFEPLFVSAYSSSHNNVKTCIVSVCFTKAEADKRQCFEIANGLHTYFSMQGMS
jgi:hypothetical protein